MSRLTHTTLILILRRFSDNMKKDKTRIGIWGQFGDGGQIADGQAVRTTIITEEIKGRYGSDNVKIVNTNRWYKRSLRFFIESISLVVNCNKIVIFPADNGFKIIVPLISLLNKYYKKELYYVVIGGFLPNLLNRHRTYVSLLSKFDAIFVQTPNLKSDLEKLGLKKIFILSNLKRLDKINTYELRENCNKKIKVCTFSRVTYTKGIEDAIEGVRIANEKLKENLFKLDIYGPVDEKYKHKFNSILDSNKNFVEYKGVINYYDSIATLKNYFALVFPTFFHGEGFPGNFIDSFNSGLPIITTDWMYNKEIIKDKHNGLIVPIRDSDAISDALLALYNDRKLALKISRNNLVESEKYKPSEVLKDFFTFLDNVY